MRPLRLAYYQDKRGNFGDDLNPWLWERLLPGLIDDQADETLFGVGTILENWFVRDLRFPSVKKIVLGSGSGMQYPLVQLDPSWNIYGVRGPLTAHYLSLGPEMVLTDPAMCLNFLWPRTRGPKRRGVGFIPHHTSVDSWNWEALCHLAGMEFINPRAPYLEVIERISSLDKLITEAMHGAIIADALRVPWRAARVNPNNYTGKWDDWASTVGLPVHFLPLPSLFDPVWLASGRAKPAAALKVLLGRGSAKSSRREREWAVLCLRNAAESGDFYLSDDRRLQTTLSRFMVAIDALKRDRGRN